MMHKRIIATFAVSCRKRRSGAPRDFMQNAVFRPGNFRRNAGKCDFYRQISQVPRIEKPARTAEVFAPAANRSVPRKTFFPERRQSLPNDNCSVLLLPAPSAPSKIHRQSPPDIRQMYRFSPYVMQKSIHFPILSRSKITPFPLAHLFCSERRNASLFPVQQSFQMVFSQNQAAHFENRCSDFRQSGKAAFILSSKSRQNFVFYRKTVYPLDENAVFWYDDF